MQSLILSDPCIRPHPTKIMTGAIIILLVTLSVGLVLYVYDLKWRRAHPDEADKDTSAADAADGTTSDQSEDSNNEGHGEICCGRHLICEKSLIPEPGEKPVYYDDEELDRFAGRADDSYTDEETEEFREIMLTMQPADLPGWARSLQLRRVMLPLSLRDEFFLLLNETPQS